MDILKVIEQRKEEAKRVKESGTLNFMDKKENKDTDLEKVDFTDGGNKNVIGFNFA